MDASYGCSYISISRESQVDFKITTGDCDGDRDCDSGSNTGSDYDSDSDSDSELLVRT